MRNRRIRLLEHVARELRGQAGDRFALYGGGDARGIALWDAGCWVDENIDYLLDGAR